MKKLIIGILTPWEGENSVAFHGLFTENVPVAVAIARSFYDEPVQVLFAERLTPEKVIAIREGEVALAEEFGCECDGNPADVILSRLNWISEAC